MTKVVHHKCFANFVAMFCNKHMPLYLKKLGYKRLLKVNFKVSQLTCCCVRSHSSLKVIKRKAWQCRSMSSRYVRSRPLQKFDEFKCSISHMDMDDRFLEHFCSKFTPFFVQLTRSAGVTCVPYHEKRHKYQAKRSHVIVGSISS